MKFSVIFICITIGLIGYVNGNCAKCCNTPNYHSLHGPLKVFYEGEKCDCGRTIPVHVEQLRVQPSRQLKQHDYNIEVVTAPKEPTYGSFDFHREVLKVDPEKRLQSYNYDVYSPPEPPADPALSSYQYIVESVKPAAERQPAVLYGHVDRLVVPSEDCGEPKESPKPVVHGCGACGNCPCNCNSRTQTKKVESSGRLSDIFSLNLKKDNLDVISFSH
uniref:CSON003016 protein n=1 Tax=Culicoides sonorensis TaxID=179676 RepID=A0A336MKF2_CULSO